MRYLILFFIIASSNIYCNTTSERIIKVYKCCEDLLINLKKEEIYQDVITSFKDTAKIFVSDKRYFGIPSYVDNRLDEFVFFNRDKNKCLLLMLQRMKDTLSFGACRIINGLKRSHRIWVFEVGRDISFDRSYFEIYMENSFTNISMLARYSVWVQGKRKAGNCEIDDQYWFGNR